MKKLSRDNYLKAVGYLQAHGRLLEQRLFAYEFESGPARAALEALAEFQNPDGGYGHGLEPDIRAGASSVIATSQALGRLRHLNAGADEPQVQAAVAYLLAQFDPVRRVWPIVPPEVEAAPHAPWWTFASSAETFDGFIYNPRAEVVAHLTHYRALVPQEFLAQVTQSLTADLEADRLTISKDCYLCLRELAETDGAPSGLKEAITTRLVGLLPGLVQSGSQRWQEYGLTPLEAAPCPGTPWSAALDPAELQAELDELIERQLEDGSWPLTWSWEFVDAEAWAQAQREWKGVAIVNHLLALRAYDRLEQ